MTITHSIPRYTLFKTLRRHTKLSERRNAAYDQNRSAKYLIGALAVFMVGYLMFLAVMFSLIVNDSDIITGYEFMYVLAPFILLVGFLLRFAALQTPTQLVKPYVLLPIPRFACIDCFLVNTLLSPFNLLGFAIFLPFAIMSVVFSEGLVVALGFLTGLLLLVLLNSQWYILVRSLINKHLAWWTLPIAVYAAMFSPLFLKSSHSTLTLQATPSFDTFAEIYSQLGEGLSFWNPLCYIFLLALFALLFSINRRLQHQLISHELGKTATTSKAHELQLSLLDRWGATGEYMKLEVRSFIRNKNLRKSFLAATVVVILFSLVMAYTEVYDSPMWSNFWCIYCFALYGCMLLTKIMCYEGNYIECLMVHRENIISLLRAKYYLYCILLVLPFLLLLPTVFMEKCTLLQLFAYAVFTAGAAYGSLFQLAVYNKQTMPLNTKFTGKGGMENSYLQVVVQLVVFFFPLLYVQILLSFLDTTIAYIVILITGLLLVATHNLWLRNIYRRMMKRRYANLEGFRASR